MPLLLLPYSPNLQALTAHTSNVIQGSAPYLTFDGGKTKAITTDDLLNITLLDGTIVTPSTNTSSVTNPITLPKGSTLSDIHMLIPSSVDSVSLNDIVNTYHYWGDDDGDGQEINGVTATGSLSASFTDKNGNTASRRDILDICKAPYKLILNSTEGILKTQYGIPNTNYFHGQSVAYYISPNLPPKICHVRPNLTYGAGDYAGPANIWNPTKGFLVQSTNPTFYELNFPTTGADGLYFDLDIGGGSQLTWTPVTHGGITATVTRTLPNAGDNWISNHSVEVMRVTLTGPRASDNQKSSDSPSPLSKPILPQTFELVGRDSQGSVVVKYGFVLKQWFVNRGSRATDVSKQASWCSHLGYRFPQVRDLTNAVCSGKWSGLWCQGSASAMPSSSGNHYQRRIGAGFFTEWGDMLHYSNADFADRNYWTSDIAGGFQFGVDSDDGDVLREGLSISRYGLCAAN
ncbi:hypothetical protein [Gilliamella bombi]|uniref:hypothetical protein n=1 Tax=Gilliamella bombi TaxID=1908521 RepID=UPI001179CBD2|nr:hypothetical protein [Gilliamella bombi]